ncbi:uncharacterized protein [Panulirus ornatus]|uniref:uncharacterized protein n=1 Tax=Panulirus ornatus TaxID=150431 RepID=UPI003A84EAA8
MKPLRLSLVLILLGLGTWSEARKGNKAQKENCEPRHLQGCMNQLQAINKDHNLAFASTEAELNKMCSTMETGLDCVHNHVTRCFETSRQRVIYQLLTGTEDIIKSLCMAGNFRDQYLVHVACMRNLSTDNLVCGNQYKRLISTVSPPEKLNFEDSIRHQCCAFHNYLLCVTSAAERECGLQAAHFIEKYSYRTAGPLIQTRCKMYVPGSLECTHNSAALSRATILLAVSLLLVAPVVLTSLL